MIVPDMVARFERNVAVSQSSFDHFMHLVLAQS
jgi:hypothetical protein